MAKKIFGVYPFFDDLRAFLCEIQTLPGIQFVCGDFNCPGSSSDTIDERLSDAIDDFNMFACSGGATRITPDGSPGNLLDLIIHNADHDLVTDFKAVDAGIADHMLIMTSIHLSPTKIGVTIFKGRNLKKLDYALLQSELTKCSFVCHPSGDVNSFVDQMNSDVTAVLNRLAPVHITKKRIGKNSASELSSEAIEAKRPRRRCEKKFRKTKSNLDRLAYWRAVRVANQLIIASAQESNQKKLNDVAGDQKLLCKISNSILHRKGEPDGNCDPIQQSNLCTSFKNFFINKILKIRRDIYSCQVVQHQLNFLQSLTEMHGLFQWLSPSIRGRSGFHHQLYEVQEFSNRNNSNCRAQTVRRHICSIPGPSCQSLIQCRSIP